MTMTSETNDDAGEPVIEVELDPFGYLGDAVSAVRGLNRDEEPADPFYIFHTFYVDFTPGLVEADLTFVGLRSRKDRMMVSVHSFEIRTEALGLVLKDDFSLRTLAASGGKASIAFEVQEGYRYAILARTGTPSDAVGKSLTVTCRNYPGRAGKPVVASDRNEYRAKGMRDVATLVTNRPVKLAKPMSQACTSAQLKEPTFREWQSVLGFSDPADRFQWEPVFVLNVLKAFGVIDAGGTGLGFGRDYDVMARALNGLGCTTASAEALAAAAKPAQPSEDGAETKDGYESPVALPPPSVMRSYDFLWSLGLCDVLSNPVDLIYLVEDSIEYLKPGGMAVHILTAQIGRDQLGQELAPGTFDRNRLAQLSLAVVGGKHEIAQLNMYSDPDDDGPHSFGIIIRKNAT
ncbi:hypothetical protein ACFSGX_16760 [Sphingomonas arantia]|uniref:Uncharacterized protein n=2 Tax=Sphingomonas arantia TaxID=1460676 RepID=A0ABW4U4C0_9SPHN